MIKKYPKILHLPWSKGLTKDDARIKSLDAFENREVVVTEKMDGENCNLHKDVFHARSVDSRDHLSRHWAKNLWYQIKYKLDDLRICGENVYAQHSIAYDGLSSYFLMFGAMRENMYLSWDTVVELAEKLDLFTVPVLYRGTWDPESIKVYCTGTSYFGTSEQEGYVVRLADEFSLDDFDKSIAKFVRAGHVQTDDHWMHRKIVKNKLRKRIKKSLF